MINLVEIQNIPIFTSLEPTTCQAIAQRAFKVRHRAEYNLVIEDMPAEFCYFLLSGEVRVFRMNLAGRVQVLARFRPICPLNVISLLVKDRLNQASVETLTPVSVLVIGASDFDALVDRFPDFSKMLLQIFAERMTVLTNLASDLSLLTVRSRLARFLIDLADQHQFAGGWTQDEIAAHIGTVRDVVGRLLRDFESQGIISRDRQRIIILDHEKLSQEAEIPPP